MENVEVMIGCLVDINNNEEIEISPLLNSNNMIRESLDIRDKFPEDMERYLQYNGRHFNRKLCDYATSMMKSSNSNSMNVITKEALDELLKRYNVKIENNMLYDYVYVANMCKADFYGSSITDDPHLCKYVKDVIDDKDGYDGIVFTRWYADMCRQGIPIDWYSYL